MKVQEKNVLAAVEGQQGVDGQEQRSDGSGGGGVSGAGASPENSGTPGDTGASSGRRWLWAWSHLAWYAGSSHGWSAANHPPTLADKLPRRP